MVEYKFPISNDKNCLYGLFAFDLKTANVKCSEYREAYAARVYQLNNFFMCFNEDLKNQNLLLRDRMSIYSIEKAVTQF